MCVGKENNSKNRTNLVHYNLKRIICSYFFVKKYYQYHFEQSLPSSLGRTYNRKQVSFLCLG